MSLALVKGFCGFTETSGKTIVNESGLQDLLQRDRIMSSGQRGTDYFKRT